MSWAICLALLTTGFCASGGELSGGSVVAVGLIDGKPCSERVQRLIDANPNREIFFPDGPHDVSSAYRR